jgi:hypothetical protein
VFRAKWVIKEHPTDCTDIESMMKLLFENYLMPEIAFGIREQYSDKSQQLEELVAEHRVVDLVRIDEDLTNKETRRESEITV